MSYREAETVDAEAAANAAIDDAIEDAIAESQVAQKRDANRGMFARWFGRVLFLVGLSVAGVGVHLASHWVALVGVVLVMLSAGVALTRLGGGLSANAGAGRASSNEHRSGL